MSELAIIVGLIVLAVASAAWERRRSPHCQWCDGRHFGRCIYNPRAGRIFSNARDGHFDYYDPNK